MFDHLFTAVQCGQQAFLNIDNQAKRIFRVHLNFLSDDLGKRLFVYMLHQNGKST